MEKNEGKHIKINLLHQMKKLNGINKKIYCHYKNTFYYIVIIKIFLSFTISIISISINCLHCSFKKSNTSNAC